MKAVIFDMDGVLINTEPTMRKSAIAALAEFGVEAEEKDFMPFVGAGEDKFIGGVAELHGVPYNTDMKDRAYEIYVSVVEEQAERFENIPELMSELHKNSYKIAIASAAEAVKVNANLKAARITPDMVDVVLTGNDSKRKKPFPDAFLTAAEKLGVEPKNCIVIEDALNGIRAAKAAGMASIGITGSFTGDELKNEGASFVFDRTCDITDTVKILLP